MPSKSKRSQVKCQKKWTPEKIIRLIEEFKSREDLWSTSSQANRKQKRKLHHEIAHTMNMDEDAVITKLKNLRCQYIGEMRKLSMQPQFVSPWKYFNALKFLSSEEESTTSSSFTSIDQDVSGRNSTPAINEMQIDEANAIGTTPPNQIRSHDSQQIFGDFVASQLRSMPKAKQRRLTLLMQKAIIQVEEEPEPMDTTARSIVVVKSNPFYDT